MTAVTGPIAADFILGAAIVWAVVTDVRARRISNRLTYPLAIAGLALHALIGGWSGLGTGALGLLAGFSLLLPVYLLGGMGAGDLKLLAAIGAVKGPYFVVFVAVYAGLAGGALAVAYLVHRCGVRGSWRYLTRRHATGSSQEVAPAVIDSPEADQSPVASTTYAGLSIPYAPAIAAGFVVTLLRLA